MSYDNNNRGVLFKNKRKEKENQPDYQGNILITPDMAGRELNLAAWIKTPKGGGDKFMSLSVSEKREQKREPGMDDEPDFDDPIPF